MRKNVLFYVITLVVFGMGILFILQTGNQLTPKKPTKAQAQALVGPVIVRPSAAGAAATDSAPSAEVFAENLNHPLSRLLVQLLVILLATRLIGTSFKRIGQPAVVGEMFAGVLLGPSLFGILFPNAFNFIFPASSLGALRLFSQIGVCLFMFSVGMHLDVKHLRNRAQTALVVSHASIVFPYFLGVALALALYPTLAGPGVAFSSFALFMGISMSITAFPVLARILQERGMSTTELGSIALTCAAIGDVTAWIILALVVALVKSSGLASAFATIGLTIVYSLVMLLGLRPRLAQLLGLTKSQFKSPDNGVIAAVLAVTFASSLFTETIGIHALFGAFLAGVIMPPQSEFRNFLNLRIESFSSIFLLPLFFAFTGLRTQLGLLNSTSGWLICGAIILTATVGKLGSSMLSGRFSGLGWNDSFALGALMNTRGLMELIAVNIGYDLGILSPQIFTMLVLMALTTTFLTGPLLSFARMMKRRSETGQSETEISSPLSGQINTRT